MKRKTKRKSAERKFQICSHCGKSYPKDVDTCPFCQYKPTAVEKVGDNFGYVKVLLTVAVIAIGFLAKCVHDHHKEKKAERTEQVQKAAEQETPQDK